MIWFWAAVENDLFLASGSKSTGLLCWGVEIDWIIKWGQYFSRCQWWCPNYFFVWAGWRLTWFYRRDRTWLVYCAGVKIDFGFVCGPKLSWFSFIGRNWLGFCVRAVNDLFLVVGIDWPSFYAGGRVWLGFCMPAENHLVLVSSSNMTSFCLGGRN